MKRILYINKTPPTECEVIIINSSVDIIKLNERFFGIQSGPPLMINMINSSQADYVIDKLLNQLLKFIEEYPGDIYLACNEPVPAPIVSRFIEYHKEFVPEDRPVISLRMGKVKKSMATRLSQVVGFKLESTEEDDEE